MARPGGRQPSAHPAALFAQSASHGFVAVRPAHAPVQAFLIGQVISDDGESGQFVEFVGGEGGKADGSKRGLDDGAQQRSLAIPGAAQVPRSGAHLQMTHFYYFTTLTLRAALDGVVGG